MIREAPGYTTESNEAAAVLCKVPTRFHQLAFYSGELPRGTWIARPGSFSIEPRHGRPSLNCHVSAVPQR
jgi:hypothetical protein